MGNGAKAANRRERNQKEQKKGPTSQLPGLKQSMNIICETCRASFMSTAKAPALTEHAQNKHNKTLAECFPKIAAEAQKK